MRKKKVLLLFDFNEGKLYVMLGYCRKGYQYSINFNEFSVILFDIFILGLPTFVETLPIKINIIVGQNIELRCNAISEDRLDIAYIWTHNNLKLHSVVHAYSALVSII